MKKLMKKIGVMGMAIALAVNSITINSNVVVAGEISSVTKEVEKVDNKVLDEPVVLEELTDERTSDSTTYLLSNGMKQTTYYGDDIYFENKKGDLAEYDSELVKLDDTDKKDVKQSVDVDKGEVDKYKYVNKEGDSKQYLPKKLSEKTPIVMTNNEYVISFAPAKDTTEETNETKTGENDLSAIENSLSGATDKVQASSADVENIYDNNLENKKVIATPLT